MRSPKIITFANAKGGVGKTKSCIAMTDALIGLYGRNVLVVDFDPQSSASLYLLEGDTSALHRAESQHLTVDYYLEAAARESRQISLAKFVLHKTRLFAGDVTIRSRYGSLLASSSRLAALEERFLFEAKQKNLALSKEFISLSDVSPFIVELSSKLKRDLSEACNATAHEFVVIDTAAGAGLLAFVAMLVSDVIIVPTIPDNMSLTATARFIGQIRQFETQTGQFIPRSLLLFSKVQPGYRSHTNNIDRLSRDATEVFTAPFLQKDLISELDTSRTPRLTFEQKYGVAAGNVKAFTREIMALLQ